MKTFKNPSTSLWFEDLKEDHKLRKYIPMNFFQLINNSSLTASIYLNGGFFGEAQPYSPFNVVGASFETFTVSNENKQPFNENELIVQVSKDVSVSALPANPQIDLLQDDLDIYASGCNDRISIGEGIDADRIKYWCNVQNGLIVQRRLELEGSATIGQYEIFFDEKNKLTGSVGINSITTIDKRIKKTIINSTMDYSLTVCSITGWMIDLLKKSPDIMDSSTGGEPNIIDDDLVTYYQLETPNGSASRVYTSEFVFNSQDIAEIHMACCCYHDPAYAGIQAYYAGAWHDVGTEQGDTVVACTWYEWHEFCNLTNVTKIRLYAHGSAAGSWSSHVKFFDLSVF